MKVTMQTMYDGMSLKEYAKKYGTVKVCYAPTYYEQDLPFEGEYVLITEIKESEMYRWALALKLNDKVEVSPGNANKKSNSFQLYTLTWWSDKQDMPHIEKVTI